MIKGTTDIYCIFGHPVSHSKSPLMHNAAFNALDMDACYIAFDVKPECLTTAVQAVRALGIKGLNITVPLKESVMPLLDWISPEAKEIGSVNTIKNDNGRLLGYNTDAMGFIQSLKEHGLSLKGKKALVLGAGGAARAVVYSMLLEGSIVFIYNRTIEKAVSLCEAFKRYSTDGLKTVQGGELRDGAFLEGIDLVVNTTSLGLNHEDPLPIDPSLLKPHHRVCDLIYKKTALLQIASDKGCETIDGSGMLLWQGVYAFEIWTGSVPPVEVMRNAIGL